ncbi:hypothetical protein K474DRAFT_1770247 [Panus rudis PR-1116 ss-1]|nr:hypothetical protein K474DRAFT_1770247 [Panus rudis PR-1116 ss-1]
MSSTPNVHIIQQPHEWPSTVQGLSKLLVSSTPPPEALATLRSSSTPLPWSQLLDDIERNAAFKPSNPADVPSDVLGHLVNCLQLALEVAATIRRRPRDHPQVYDRSYPPHW